MNIYTFKRLWSILCILLLLFFSLHLILGGLSVEIQTVVKELMNPNHDSTVRNILLNLRLPRAIIAVLCGGMLGLAGALLQSVISNPLAEPGVIGVTALSTLFAVLWIIYSPFSILMSYSLPVVAAIGATLSVALLYRISKFPHIGMQKLALIGILFSVIIQAFISLILLQQQQAMGSILLWMIGSLNGRTWSQFYMVVPFALILIPIALSFAGILNGLRLGDEKARTLGINLQSSKKYILLVAGLLTAGAVSTVGAIAFVGLIGPHIARHLAGEDARLFLPISFLTSSLLLLAADIIAQVAVPLLPDAWVPFTIQLPTGAVTALIGGPFFMYLITKNMKGGKVS